MAIKYRGEKHREQVKQHVDEATEIIEKSTTLEQSFSDLKKMTNEELLDRLEQVENQAILIKWRIWWTIRQRFKSHKLFGQYLNELRNNPIHGLSVDSQQEINAMAHAGRFCEKFRINDLSRIGISPTAIREIARPANDDIARKIYQEVKGKGRTVDFVKALIQKERDESLSLPSETPKPVSQPPIEHHHDEPKPAYTVLVEKGVAINESTVPMHEETPTENSQESAKPEAFTYPQIQRMIDTTSDAGKEDDQIIESIMNAMNLYKLSPMKMIAILQLVIKRIQAETYRSQS